MTKIKLCGLTRPCDIETANDLRPEYIGFVFAAKSRRYVSPGTAASLKAGLDPSIKAVGVFTESEPEFVAGLLDRGVIDIAQLHGGEDEDYIRRLKELTDSPIIKAFSVNSVGDLYFARKSAADFILLDNGAGGTGRSFDWDIIGNFDRPFFLAGGLDPENVAGAVTKLRPFAVDVSGGIETDGVKDADKMRRFVEAVRTVSGEE